MHCIDMLREKFNQIGLQLREIAARNDCMVRDENGEILIFERDPKISYNLKSDEPLIDWNKSDEPLIDWNAVDISHEMELLKQLESKGEQK